MLARLSGAQISAEEIRLLTNRCGRELAHAQEQAHPDPAVPGTPPVALDRKEATPEDRSISGLDGGWVPSRERRGGMEGKVAVIARGKQVLREPSQPSADRTWVQVEK